MIQFKKIVLTTDLSENANAAIPYAVELARHYGGTIFLLHVFEEDIFYASMSAGTIELADQSRWETDARLNRQQRLQALAKSLGDKEGVQVVHLMKQGHAADMIATFAKAEDADCVVIATHGRTGLAHIVFGSVAENVVRLCQCPVMTVRPQL
jgi:nucleotide-binding universal stress UspA family protein